MHRRHTATPLLAVAVSLATVLLLAGNRLTFVGAVIQTLFLLAIFVPFSYFMDRLVWRSHEKRQARNASK